MNATVMITKPCTAAFRYTLMMLVRLRMLLMTESNTAPITVPVMLPAPPLSAVPPTITAAIASSSHSKPVVGDAYPKRGTYSKVAMPTHTPSSTYVITLIRSTSTAA
jgi:hypothetical protein